MKLSIVTNVSNADLPRIQNILPHWLTVFDAFVDEILIVFDNNNLSGRIKEIHKQSYSSEEIKSALQILQNIDARVKVIDLNMDEIIHISRVWFKKGTPMRCQNGSPIYPFIYGIHHAKNDFILKCDCDIVFFEKGFIQEALSKLSTYDLVSPPRNPLSGHIVSSRGFFINKKKLYENKLPIDLLKLSIIQILVRILRKQSIFNTTQFSLFFGYESALNNAINKNILSHYQITKKFGNSMHVVTNAEANDLYILKVIAAYEKGRWPTAQELYDMNYSKELWKDFV